VGNSFFLRALTNFFWVTGCHGAVNCPRSEILIASDCDGWGGYRSARNVRCFQAIIACNLLISESKAFPVVKIVMKVLQMILSDRKRDLFSSVLGSKYWWKLLHPSVFYSFVIPPTSRDRPTDGVLQRWRPGTYDSSANKSETGFYLILVDLQVHRKYDENERCFSLISWFESIGTDRHKYCANWR